MKKNYLCCWRLLPTYVLLLGLPFIGLACCKNKKKPPEPPSSPPETELAFPSARQSPSRYWDQPYFQLSQDYPRVIVSESYPWNSIDFTDSTEWQRYMWSVLEYCYDGNIEVDWYQQKRSESRRWYHAPWMHRLREWVHGMTRERPVHTTEISWVSSDTDSSYYETWAVAFYNNVGGYTIGRVWDNLEQPNPDSAHFRPGAVVIKLLFTTLTSEKIPYLENAPEWLGALDATKPSKLTALSLLQVDIAVRDRRADTAGGSGWVFGTFMYDKDTRLAPFSRVRGKESWYRLRPVGLMWGNDPDLTPEKYARGERPAQSYINPEIYRIVRSNLGWQGRLNGPVDNPFSSCLSCHATAQVKKEVEADGFTTFFSDIPLSYRDFTFAINKDAAQAWLKGHRQNGRQMDTANMQYWFRTIKPGETWHDGYISLDYSLQLRVGIETWAEEMRLAREIRKRLPSGYTERENHIAPAIDFATDPKNNPSVSIQR